MLSMSDDIDENAELKNPSPAVRIHTQVGAIQVSGQENVVNIQNIVNASTVAGAAEQQRKDWAEIESAVTKIIISESANFTPPSVHVSQGVPREVTSQIFAWVTQRITLSAPLVDSLIHGEQTAIAVQQLQRILQQAAENIRTLEDRRSQARAQADSLAQKIGAIGKELPPFLPNKPVEPALPYTRQSYEDSMARYEKLLREHQERKQTLPQLESQHQTLRYEYEQLDRELQNVAATRERDKAQFEEAISKARGRDIVLFLEQLRDAARVALAKPEHVVAGYYCLLALHGIFPLLRRLFHDSWDDATMLSTDIERHIDEATKTRHLPVFTDFLSRWQVFAVLMRQNQAVLTEMQGILAELPLEAISDFVSRSQKIFSTPLPEVPTYSTEYDPATLPIHAAKLAAERSAAENMLAANLSIQQEMSALCSRTEDTRQRAEACRLKMAVVTQQDVLDDSSLLLVLTTDAQAAALPELTKSFLALMVTETARRLGDPEALAVKCQKSKFLLVDANEAMSSHPSAALLSTRSSLQKHREKMQGFVSQLEKARSNLLARPQQMHEDHLIRLRDLSSHWLPPMQLKGAIDMSGYQRIRPALQSSLRELMPLRQEVDQCSRTAMSRALASALVSVVAAGIAGVASIALLHQDETDRIMALIVFMFTLGNAFASFIAIGIFHSARKQFQRWSEGDSNSERP